MTPMPLSEILAALEGLPGDTLLEYEDAYWGGKVAVGSVEVRKFVCGEGTVSYAVVLGP